MTINIIVGVILLAALAIEKVWTNKQCRDFEWYEAKHRDLSCAQNEATHRALDAVLTEHQSIDDRLSKIEKRLARTTTAVTYAKTTRMEKFVAEQLPKMLKEKSENMTDMYCYLYDYDGAQPCDDCPACEYCDSGDRKQFVKYLLEEVER